MYLKHVIGQMRFTSRVLVAVPRSPATILVTTFVPATRTASQGASARSPTSATIVPISASYRRIVHRMFLTLYFGIYWRCLKVLDTFSFKNSTI